MRSAKNSGATVIGALALLAVVTGGLWLAAQSRRAQTAGGVALESLLVDSGQELGFARATEPDAVQFPQDLGPHPDYQTEWWYYTGNLEDENGRPFGYQLTFFRRALRPEAAASAAGSASAWRSNQIYLAHFTVSDIEAGKFHVSERFGREGAGLAGADAEPYRVWLEDWEISEISSGRNRMRAATDEVQLDLVLEETLAPVLHGQGGLSQKGPEPGNASYYYSIVQQDTSGSVTIEGTAYDVDGLSWTDHEYSTSALSPGSAGWDWFSIQFDNGSALMLFQIRQEDGTIEPYSSGSFINADGSIVALQHDDWQLDVLETWTSPHSGAEYPSRWRLAVPALDLELDGRPLMADQELRVSTTYWEGASEFSGSLAGEPLSGRGYVEMTGYAGSLVPS